MTTKRLALLTALAFAIVSCKADNNVSVQIYAMCSLPDQECTFQETCDAQYIGQLGMDVAVTDLFWAFVEIHNQTLDNEDESVGRGNTKDAYLTEYEIRYDAQGFSLPTARGRILAAPQVVPAEGTSVISIFPIPPETSANIGPTEVPLGEVRLVTAHVRLKGKFGDESEFETAEFPMPIQVCNGCLGIFDCDLATPAVEPPTSTCPPTLGQVPLSTVCPDPVGAGTTP